MPYYTKENTVEQKKILFVCVHNSARSQMAEAFMNKLADGRYIAESAGIKRGLLNQYVVKAMAETGIDISKNKTDSVFEFFKEGRMYHYVFRVCDPEIAERCPVFPDILECINWNVPDPTSLRGTEEDIMEKTRKVRDIIRKKVEDWLKAH